VKITDADLLGPASDFCDLFDQYPCAECAAKNQQDAP